MEFKDCKQLRKMRGKNSCLPWPLSLSLIYLDQMQRRCRLDPAAAETLREKIQAKLVPSSQSPKKAAKQEPRGLLLPATESRQENRWPLSSDRPIDPRQKLAQKKDPLPPHCTGAEVALCRLGQQL